MSILVNFLLVKTLEKYIVENKQESPALCMALLTVSIAYACYSNDLGLLLEISVMTTKLIYDDAFLG